MRYRGLIYWPSASLEAQKLNMILSNFVKPIEEFLDSRLNMVPKEDWDQTTFSITELVPMSIVQIIGGREWMLHRNPPSPEKEKSERILDLKAQIIVLEKQLEEEKGGH